MTPDAFEVLAEYRGYEEMKMRPTIGEAEAMTLAHHWMPDLIVVGISMYECNGFNASLTWRNDPDTRDIANVAFTTFDAHEVRPHLVDRRFDG